MNTANKFQVPLINNECIGRRYGFGEGGSEMEAIINALNIAAERDSNAKYDRASGCVLFNESPRF
jgi:hypothetical protein